MMHDPFLRGDDLECQVIEDRNQAGEVLDENGIPVEKKSTGPIPGVRNNYGESYE